MSRIEQWGTELAMLLRRECDQTIELEKTRTEISSLITRITQADTTHLYGSTGEIPRVVELPDRPADLPEYLAQVQQSYRVQNEVDSYAWNPRNS